MAQLLHENLTRQIIGVYFVVYNRLGQMYPEYIYEKAMMLLSWSTSNQPTSNRSFCASSAAPIRVFLPIRGSSRERRETRYKTKALAGARAL